jgi:hypothetical protein
MPCGPSSTAPPSVEARYVYPTPITIGNQVFDNRWRTVDFQQSPIGVPGSVWLNRYTATLGFLPYESAQALRWWVLAELRKGFQGICLETRLVRHEVQYNLKSKAISAHDNLGGDLCRFSTNRPVDMQGEGRKVSDPA